MGQKYVEGQCPTRGGEIMNGETLGVTAWGQRLCSSIVQESSIKVGG